MSETPELPPLPEAVLREMYDKMAVDPRTVAFNQFNWFTAGATLGEQLARELYLEAGRRAGLEEAAKLCEEVPVNGNPGPERNWHQQGRQDCAAAIRAKAKP